MRCARARAWAGSPRSRAPRSARSLGRANCSSGCLMFDERNLLELSSPDYPGERLVACRNPELAKLRTHKREDLLAATARNLERIKARVDAAKLAGADAIGLRVGKVIGQYKVAKHFAVEISDHTFTFARKSDSIAAEAALDGVY